MEPKPISLKEFMDGKAEKSYEIKKDKPRYDFSSRYTPQTDNPTPVNYESSNQPRRQTSIPNLLYSSREIEYKQAA